MCVHVVFIRKHACHARAHAWRNDMHCSITAVVIFNVFSKTCRCVVTNIILFSIYIQIIFKSSTTDRTELEYLGQFWISAFACLHIVITDTPPCPTK